MLYTMNDWYCHNTGLESVPTNQSACNSQVLEGGCCCNVDVVLVVEVAKGGEGGGLEDF